LRKTTGVGTAHIGPATTNRGSIVVDIGTIFFPEVLVQESGSIALAGGNISTNVLVDVRGGTVTGSGEVRGSVKNAGQIRPGNPVGSLTIVGELEQTASGVLDIQWNGASPAHDMLTVSGTATLSGTLRVTAVDGFNAELEAVITPLVHGARVGEFTTVEGFLGSGKGATADYLPSSVTVTVVESNTTDAEITRQQLNSGMDVLRERLVSWTQPLGLPDDHLLLVGSGFDQTLALADQFFATAQDELGSVAQQVLSYEELRTALEAIGLTVIHVAGDSGNENGDHVLVLFEHTLEDLTADIPLDGNLPGVLAGLANDALLSGSLSLATDVVFSIVFGVDADGFFIDGTTEVRLAQFTVGGDVSGSADIGGRSDVVLAGTANASAALTINLVPAVSAGRYRTDDLWSDPSSFLQVEVHGDAHLALAFEIGPALLTWEGSYDVTTGNGDVISTQLSAMSLTGTVSLPELQRLVNGVPEAGGVAVEAQYVADAGGTAPPNSWVIHADGAVSEIYQLGGLSVEEIVFDAIAGPNLFTGDFSATLSVPFAEEGAPLVVDLTAEFGSHQMIATIVTSFDERYIGENFLWLEAVDLTTSIEVHFDQPSLKLDFAADAAHAVLFVSEPATLPGQPPQGVVTLTGLHGTLDRAGVLDIRIDDAVAEFSTFRITAEDDPAAGQPAVHLLLGPGQPADFVVLTIHEGTLTFPALDNLLSLTAQNMQFARGGTFSMDEAEVHAPQGILGTLGLAGLLPLDVTRIHVAGIDNSPFTTQDFAATITVDGKFDFSYLADTPLENLQIQVGAQSPDNAFTFTFLVANGTVRIEDTGPITLSIADMEFGPLVVTASLTVGAYVDGEFSDNDAAKGVTFSGSFTALWMQEETSLGAGVTVNEGSLDILPDGTRLNVNATFDVSFTHADSPFTFERLGVTFDLQLNVSPSFAVTDFEMSLLSATADLVEIQFGDLFVMRAEDASFDFTVFGSENVADVPFATFGNLTVQFGDPAAGEDNPLSGLGGSAGNFAVGFVPAEGGDPPRPRFYQLPDFFVHLDIPNVFPSWLPIDLNEFGFKFPDEDVIFGSENEPVKIDQLGNATILASGQVRSTDYWPITGLVEDLEFSIQDIRVCGQYLIDQGLLSEGETVLDGIERNLLALLTSDACPFPVKNLDAIEIAIEPITIGGIAIGGGLGLGLLDIDVNDDGDTDDPEDTTAFYGRILGQLEYSDMGFGAELIVTQYGPVLGRLYVGVPVPIGGLVGAVVGAFFFGVGASAGYQIGDATGFILTGFEGGMTFGDPLATIDDPLEILYNDQIHAPLKVDLETTKQKVAEAVRNQELTWDSGFTLAVSGVLTNKYVNGMIGSKVTLGANVGYGDEVGFQLYGISDVIEVADIPLVSAGLLFDFTDPEDPSQFNPWTPTVNMAFALPGTRDSVLAMLLPAKAELGMQLTTDGVADAAIGATKQFVTSLLDGSIEFGQQIFDAALTQLASLLEAERSDRQSAGRWTVTGTDIPSRLLHLILDSNADDVLSDSERAVAITRQHLVARIQDLLVGAPDRAATLTESLVSRLLDAATHVVSQLGSGHPAVQQLNELNSQPYFVERLSELVETLPIEFYQRSSHDPPAEWPTLPAATASLQPLRQAAEHGKELYAAFAYHVQNAILQSTETFFDIADPALTIRGALQPYLLGIPLGDPLGQVEGRLDKQGVTLSVDTTVGTLFNAATLVGSLLGAPDIPVGMTVSLPIGDTIQNVLFDGATFPLLDPEDQRWVIELRSGLRVANFDVATLKGLGFPSGAADELPLLGRLQKVFEDRLADPDVEIDASRIPIQDADHFDAITEHGGILLSGVVQVPRLITDPFEFLASVDLEVPDNVLEYPAWLSGIIDELTEVQTPGRIQLFAPSIAEGLTVNLADPCPAGGSCDESDRIARDEVAINDIIADAYLEGTWEGKLLGIPLGNARIDGTSDGLEIQVQDPLLGLDVTVLASWDERLIGGQAVKFPRASAEVTLDTDQALDLLDKLNLPAFLRNEFVDAEGTLRWYSPGYSGNPQEPDRLKRVGGLEAVGYLHADLFDVFDATFTGALDSTGDYAFAASDLSYSFPFGVGTISGNADFSLAGTVGSSDVDYLGHFSGALTVGRASVASVNATIDAYGCLQGTLSYFDGTGTVDLPHYELRPGACGPHLLVDDLVVAEADENATGSVVVRLTESANIDVLVDYYVEFVDDTSDGRDKATASDVIFSQQVQRVAIPKGQITTNVRVTIKGDDIWEPSEIFRVRVVSAPGAILADPVGIVTIVDDDVDDLVDSVLDQLDPQEDAIVWFDFQNDDNLFDATADDAPPVISSSSMAHSLALEDHGRTGLPGENGPGRGASSTQWANQEGYFEFTVTFDHDEPLDIRFDHLEFWDRRGTGHVLQRYQGPQEWQVYTSLDGYQTPLPRQKSLLIDSGFFNEHNLPAGTELDALLGWRHQQFVLESALDPGYVLDLPLSVTFRMVGQYNVPTIVDNVALVGRVRNPCESDLELACVARLVDDVVRWQDSLVGYFDATLLGPGYLEAVLAPRGGDIDPTRYQELVSLEVIGADPEQTTVLIEVEHPDSLPAGTALPLGTITSDNGLLRLDISGVPAALVRIESAGPIRELAAAGVAAGSQIDIGGSAQDLTTITSSADIGSTDGVGVDLISSGIVAVLGESWLGGNWDVAEVATAEFMGGDFSPAVSILGGFDAFIVTGGNFAPPLFTSGVGATANSGGGNEIQARAGRDGAGGSILAGDMSIHGDLALLEAVGGKISTNLTAQHIGIIRATRDATPGDAGNIDGLVQATSMDLVQSIGGDITATLITSDAAHRRLRVEALADPDFLPSGRIDSRHSFHIAGGAEAIRAHDIALRLVAGDRVELIELIGDDGGFAGDLTARSFGLVQGRAAHLDVALRTPYTEQPPPAGSFVWAFMAGPSGAVADFQITELAREAVLKLSVDEQGQPLAIDLEQLTPALLEENVSGVTLGPTGVPATWNSEPLTIVISDARFELRDGRLALTDSAFMQANVLSGERVVLSAVSADGASRWRETFVISVEANPFPWHHKQLPLDVNDDGDISPIDALQIINRLTAGAPPQLPTVRPATDAGPVKWYDVAADGFVSPLDALRVINYLNGKRDAEGEATTARSDSTTERRPEDAPLPASSSRVVRGFAAMHTRLHRVHGIEQAGTPAQEPLVMTTAQAAAHVRTSAPRREETADLVDALLSDADELSWLEAALNVGDRLRNSKQPRAQAISSR